MLDRKNFAASRSPDTNGFRWKQLFLQHKSQAHSRLKRKEIWNANSLVMWSCALGLAASMDATLPSAEAELGATDRLTA